MGRVYESLQHRLLSLSVPEDNGYEIDGEPSECWVWIGNVDNKGYGRLSLGRRETGTPISKRAHIVSYEFFVGKVQEGMTLDHRCRVHGCIHPNHLAPVTRAENTSLMRQWYLLRDKERSGQMEIETA